MLSSVSTIQPLTMPANLPDDINQLKQIIAQLHQQVNDLSQDNQTQAEEISELKTQVEYMREQLNLSKSKRFGKQSEKAPRGTFNEAEQQAKAEPKHHKKGKQKLPEHLERETRVYTLDAPVCDCCQQSMHACGTQESEQLKIIPEKVSVIRHQQTKYACRSCEQTQTKSQIITASKPAQPIPGSVASPQALAAVVTAKYCDALPLYRQEDILKRGGLSISRTTLANWCIKAGQIVEPMVACFKQNLLASTVASADETTVQVLDEPGKDASSKSYMWVYRSGVFNAQPVVVYDYQPGRSHEYPKQFLQGFSGALQCDGYQAYDNIEHVIPVACWAHARRKFNDAKTASPKKTGRAQKALSFISKLYRIEAKAKDYSPDKRQALRQEAIPILTQFKAWLDEAEPQLTPKSYIGKAVRYTLNQWEKLIRYTDDGQLSIDNNHTERDIRPFTTGRKNWLFSKTVKGAEASAILYSIVMTCRANDINPYYYFEKLFAELPQREPGADLTDLLPWNVKQALD